MEVRMEIEVKVGDKIAIGDDVILMVTRLDGPNVKIGIDAPKEILILRRELIKGRLP
jgi:carbon storage regulator